MGDSGHHIVIENASKLLQQMIHDDSKNAAYVVRQTTECSEDHLIFSGKKSGTLHEWISQLNTKLSTTASRLEGLVLLRAVIKQCSRETFTECCITWTRLLINIFQPHQSQHIVNMASGILVEIIQEASPISELSRELAVSHIPGLLATLLSGEDEWVVASLRLLLVCMHHFPGPCGSVSYKLEAFITSHLTSSQADIQELAQQCYPLLASLGGGGSKGVKHTEAYSLYAKKLLLTASNLLSMMYTDYIAEPARNEEEDVDLLQLPGASVEEPLRTFQLTSQLETVVSCLINMLRGDFPAPAVIPLSSILEFITNALDVNTKTLSEHVSVETSVLALVLPRLHHAALQLLDALVESCSVTRYNHQINQVLVRSLGWTETKDRALFSTLRCATYKVLVTWLKTAGALSGLAQQVGEKIVHHCITDASLPTDSTKLVSGAQTKVEKKGGKVKVKGKSGMGSELAGKRRANHHAVEMLCISALQVLRELIMSSGVKLKAGLHNEIYGLVIPLLTRIQSSAASDVPHPYTSPACREQLYKVLLAGVLVPNPQALSPLCLAVGLFRGGKNDRSLEVSGACAEAALICESIIHPRWPPRPPPPSSNQTPLLLTLQSPVSTSVAQPDSVESEMDTLDSKTDTSSDFAVDTSSVKTTSAREATSSHSETRSDVASSADIVDDSVEAPGERGQQGDASASQTLRQGAKGDIERGQRSGATGSQPEGDLVAGGEEIEEEEEVEGEDEEEGEEEESGDVPVEQRTVSQDEFSSESGSRKRKLEAAESQQVKKPASEEVECMMSAFVDAPPDSD